MPKTARRKPPAKHPQSIKRMRIWYKRLREPMLTLLLIVQIFIVFVMPILRSGGLQIPHFTVYWVLLLFVTMAIILARSRVAIVMVIASFALDIIGIIMRQEQPDLMTYAISATGQILTQVSLLWVVATAVFGPGRTTHHRILGAVVMYLSIGMIFTTLYILLAQTLPGSLTHIPANNFELRENMTYFSFSTLTTGSFGDILPVHPIARTLANLESICGQLFPATLLARIVSLHGSKRTAGGL